MKDEIRALDNLLVYFVEALLMIPRSVLSSSDPHEISLRERDAARLDQRDHARHRAKKMI
ncbi:unnamed protein product [Trichogramma brassicae]|uniref:Uncharacterized protein n=1 Tax=Trichogramma brassicae TaxID=86971 RepID=A0A6H5I3D8_9HYME|nr:unnamed protein product [Trichogramma brassicae]